MTSFLAYAIPDVPAQVKDKLEAEERKTKNLRLAAMEQEYQELLNQKRESV